MVFNSWKFVLFFALVYFIYLLLRRHYRFQNVFLLGASYVFYGVWDWRFAALLALTTLIDYCCGLGMGRYTSPRLRRTFLLVSLTSNLTVLGFFKYYNFFLGSLDTLLGTCGLSVASLHLHIILPVGLSFYTFQAITYTVGVYRGELPPEKSFLDFALMVAFFPQLVAGPIERARVLLAQINRPRTLDEERFQTGCWLILWGLWKKIVLADNLAAVANQLFGRSDSLTAGEAYLAVLAFAFQIYCDFSAYSDIARGTARLMGFELMLNFNCPYFAVGPSDFWRRWHISLSTWLRDYLYVPLGGNRGGTLLTYRNLLLTMLIGGLWHGASWNFVWWGLYHGLLLCAWRLAGDRPGVEESWSLARRVVAAIVFFQFTLFGWLLFRCNRTIPLPGGGSVDDSFAQIMEMLTSFQNGWALHAPALSMLGTVLLCAVPLLLIEGIEARRGRTTGEFVGWARPALVTLGTVLLFTWVVFGITDSPTFIYFQF
jgi:D-alanyl-lipoteichoic acid acyltransferase DltB (MBOAT superfamily)